MIHTPSCYGYAPGLGLPDAMARQQSSCYAPPSRSSRHTDAHNPLVVALLYHLPSPSREKPPSHPVDSSPGCLRPVDALQPFAPVPATRALPRREARRLSILSPGLLAGTSLAPDRYRSPASHERVLDALSSAVSAPRLAALPQNNRIGTLRDHGPSPRLSLVYISPAMAVPVLPTDSPAVANPPEVFPSASRPPP